VAESTNRLQGSLEYNTDIFDAAAIQRLLGHYETILDSAVKDPEQRISRLPILTDAERRQLLGDFNRSDNDVSASLPCLHQLFEQQVASHPDHTALIAGSVQLTYSELNERANQLAHFLRRLGVGAEVRVGLCVERSVELVVGILGVLKAGAAYVPLDPHYPSERLSHMLEDSAVPVLLTQQEFREKLDFSNAKVVSLDEEWPVISSYSTQNPPALALPDNLMYVIYTSGSTGKPKGSLITHANAARLFETTNAWYKFSEADVWTMFHSYAFDFSVWELWGALRYGGTLVIVPAQVTQSPEELYDLLHEQQVTILNLTPSVFRQFLPIATKQRSKRLSLRLIIFGGEALDLNSLKPWFECYGFDAPRLINMYGITETTVHVTYRPLTSNDYPITISSPIGVPLSDLQAYILDANLQPVPMNVPGELYIAGAGLARGYLNMPALTATRFLPNPFGAVAGDRLYRTGDRARFLEDREIEYLGRVDDQVKIRGFRIEVGEVEAAIKRHELVRDVVVVPYEETPGDKRLSAYIVLHEQASSTTGELRDYLSAQLPAYMIPSFFVFMDALPLMQNGKIDKRALPVPNSVRPAMAHEYVAPRNELEEEIAKMWSKVLRVERVGVYDNFFELGGHSLLAAQLVSRLRDTFDVELPIRSLFDALTIDGLAIAILHFQTQQGNPDEMAEALAELEDLAPEAQETERIRSAAQ
jgi:amino acid adenylation domain-containing protein